MYCKKQGLGAGRNFCKTKKKWRVQITGYQICKIKIRCFLRISTALKREHHFIKKSPSSGADLRSRLLKGVHRCNGASTRAPKSTKKLKNCYEFTDYVKVSKTSVSIESVRKSAQRELHQDDQKRATQLRVSEKTR